MYLTIYPTTYLPTTNLPPTHYYPPHLPVYSYPPPTLLTYLHPPIHYPPTLLTYLPIYLPTYLTPTNYITTLPTSPYPLTTHVTYLPTYPPNPTPTHPRYLSTYPPHPTHYPNYLRPLPTTLSSHLPTCAIAIICNVSLVLVSCFVTLSVYNAPLVATNGQSRSGLFVLSWINSWQNAILLQTWNWCFCSERSNSCNG